MQAPDGPVLVGLRPEHIDVTEAGAGLIDATLDLVEPMGNETMTSCTVAGTLMQTCGTERIENRWGAPVGLSFDPAKLHFFDASSERRLDLTACRPELEIV